VFASAPARARAPRPRPQPRPRLRPQLRPRPPFRRDSAQFFRLCDAWAAFHRSGAGEDGRAWRGWAYIPLREQWWPGGM